MVATIYQKAKRRGNVEQEVGGVMDMATLLQRERPDMSSVSYIRSMT